MAVAAPPSGRAAVDRPTRVGASGTAVPPVNYLNEFDPVAAAWLRELRDAGLIPPCDIDTRNIEDVTPNDLRGYTQCHFFAGIGGWPLALQLAGWPADRPIWTGSCPCQPFSAAGKNNGFADERHLWPAFHWLIEQCRPAVVVGEQVASAAVGPWIDLVLTDLEALGYASGAYAGPAAGVGAPHIRDRSYWAGYTDDAQPLPGSYTGVHSGQESAGSRNEQFERLRADGGLAHAACLGERPDEHRPDCGDRIVLVGSEPRGHSEHDGAHVRQSGAAGPTNGHWRAADWLGCRDGKWRPVEPGTQPLAHGVPARVGRLRGYGNAIVPQQAAQFVQALMEYQACSPN
ncbi:DNA cytosine methyltransferase [Xanthomonas phage BsXeu269p/3]|nr:DNA cytosine methyltransferase [Xanthomonas phage BsXeu269p/3]